MEFEHASKAMYGCPSVSNPTFKFTMKALGEDLRDEHEKLLIGIADQLWVCIKALLPCLFNYPAAGISFALVERCDLVELDLLVNQGLKGWGCLIAMVMATVVMAIVIVTVIIVVVMMMRRHFYGGARIGGS